MSRIMYDSIDLRAVPKDGQLVAYYVNGDYAVPRTYVESLFPPDRYSLPGIDVNTTGAHEARILDVEQFDASPDQTEQWCNDWKATNPAYEFGGRPVIYCSRDNIQAVRVGTGPLLLGRDYFFWIATGDGTIYTGSELQGPYAQHGVVACQYLWTRGYDKSIVFSPQWMPN